MQSQVYLNYAEVHDFDNFKLHAYYTNDVMGDAAFIIEGKSDFASIRYPTSVTLLRAYQPGK